MLAARGGSVDPLVRAPPKKVWVGLLAFAALGAVAFAIYGHGRYYAVEPLAAPTTDAELPPIATAIDDATAYLVRFNTDGRFVYRQHVDGQQMPRTKYNVLRHAGSIYSLGHSFGRPGGGEPATRAVIVAAARYLVEHYVRPLRDENANALAVWSIPREEGSQTGNPQAKLGGAALGVIALETARAIDPTAVPLETAQGLGRFILFMQEEEGSFRSKYEDESGFDVDFDSLYYPGEAILALTLLYEADHDERWLEAAVKGVAYLVESRRGSLRLPNDHWLMIAIDRLLPHYGELDAPPLPRADVLAHSIALGRRMLEEQTEVDGRVRDPDLAGSFVRDGRSTPVATRLEGLVALEHTLASEPDHAEDRALVRRGIQRGIAFLRRCQVREGPLSGGFTEALKQLSGMNDERRESQGEVRIDYVQHALSALIGYERMCASGGAGC